jgi:hypothetical protein
MSHPFAAQAGSLPDEQRRDYAEKIALAFAAALDGGESGDGGDDSDTDTGADAK